MPVILFFVNALSFAAEKIQIYVLKNVDILP